jgi:hypothetical protein
MSTTATAFRVPSSVNGILRTLPAAFTTSVPVTPAELARGWTNSIKY